MSRKIAFAILSVYVLVMLTGCTTMETEQKGELRKPQGLQVARVLQFPDIPVPSGFNFMPDMSFSSQGTGYRVGEFVYSGGADALELIRFYREQLPTNGWEELRNLDVGMKAILYFRKGEERCTIIIQRGSTLKSAQIRISLL